MRCAALLAVASLLVASCGGRAARSGGAASPAVDTAALAIPPAPDAAEALAALAERAEAGDAGAAWERVHYLLDLFDDARFRGDAGAASRELLARALGLDPAARGPAATDAAARALLAEVDTLLAAERLHPGAQAARVLLDLDLEPRTAEGAFSRAQALKRIARGGGPVAANALLRLAGTCRRALADAAAAPSRREPLVLAHCLYPLYDADPAPYLSADPAARPPAPAWRDLVAGTRALVDGIGAGDRLARAATAQRDWLEAFSTEAAGDFGAALDPIAAALPAADGATPYDGAPRVELGDASTSGSADDHARALAVPVEGDGRGAVAVALAAHAPATALVPVAEGAVRAGAHELRLLVATEQRLSVPPGDYWSERLGGERVTRLGAVPLSLAPFGADPSASPQRGPRARTWDPSRAALGLHLIVGVKEWRLVAATGELARIPSSTADRDPRAALRRELVAVRAAFADEDGLVLVPGDGATHAALVAAATGAARDADGAPLFSRLALAPKAPKQTSRTLARRVERRARARVTISPDALAARAPIARRCYQDLLERSPKLAGTLRLERGEDGVTVTSGPRAPALRQCALDALSQAMQESGTHAAEIAFSTAP